MPRTPDDGERRDQVERDRQRAQRRVLLGRFEQHAAALRASVEVGLDLGATTQRDLPAGHLREVVGRDVRAGRRTTAQVRGEVRLTQALPRAPGELPHRDVAQAEPLPDFGCALALDLQVPEHGAPAARQRGEGRRRERHGELIDGCLVGTGGDVPRVAWLEGQVVTHGSPPDRVTSPRRRHVAHRDEQVREEVAARAVLAAQCAEYPRERLRDKVLGKVRVADDAPRGTVCSSAVVRVEVTERGGVTGTNPSQQILVGGVDRHSGSARPAPAGQAALSGSRDASRRPRHTVQLGHSFHHS